MDMSEKIESQIKDLNKNLDAYSMDCSVGELVSLYSDNRLKFDYYRISDETIRNIFPLPTFIVENIYLGLNNFSLTFLDDGEKYTVAGSSERYLCALIAFVKYNIPIERSAVIDSLNGVRYSDLSSRLQMELKRKRIRVNFVSYSEENLRMLREIV
jgi:hypothetical protein